MLFQLQEEDFTVEKIYNKYLGKENKKKENILSHYNRYLIKLHKLIGIEIKEITYAKFVYVSNHVECFIKWKYNKSDYPFEELSLQFLNDFEYYLKTEKKQKQITINKTIQRLRTPIKEVISEGYLDRDPFLLHKAKRVRKEVIFLTVEELKTLEEYTFSQSRLSLVRDLFIFCCYTGLAYNEMVNLKESHIQKGFDGMQGIQMTREKTQKTISVPLLAKANDMIYKFISSERHTVFPILSNQKFNSYLKEIAEIVGIDKNLTHHIGRKTFATTVLLYNDIPMEIVSELLGHSKMSITQEYYGKVLQKKVSEHILKLREKFNRGEGQ